jgi:hypothetical protein
MQMMAHLRRSALELMKVSSYMILSISSLTRVTGSKPSPLADEGAWRILEEFLTTSMTYPQMEEAFQSYLGLRYSEDEWKEARLALFSGDGDDDVALENLRVVKAKHIPQPPCAHNVYSATDKRVSRARVRPSRKVSKI